MATSTPLQRWDDEFNTNPETYTFRGVVNTLRKYADNHTLECWPSMAKLKANTGLTERGIRKQLDKAVEAGWLVRLRIGHHGTSEDGSAKNISSKYKLKFPHEDFTSVPTTYRATQSPEPIPCQWHVNGIHVNKCKRLGLRANALGGLLKAWAVGESVKSSNWDTKFTAMLNVIESERDPEIEGFTNISQYLPPDAETFEWWNDYALDN
ncbi:helix-turn-helix domain-containing protein [Gordonia sp. CPCC 206044]|uniref:helix-turn-helix domain-containing protein n=1 Tax=Gordonia sp. CPCC 206044 TaxID=3140793 RepID=UPI003AF35F55